MFEKEILTALRTSYSNLGLGEVILKAKAEQLSLAVDTEDKIAEAVAGVKSELSFYQSILDSNRTLKAENSTLKKTLEEKPEENKGGENKQETGEQEPQWMKDFKEQMKIQTELIQGFQAEKTAQTNAQKLQLKLDELKVSKSIQALIPAGLTFENDEAIEAYATEMKTKSDAIAQEFGNAALGSTPKPLFGEAKKEGEVSPDVQAYLDSKKPVKTNE